MIVDERFVTFINSMDTGNTPLLDEIEREAKESYVPIIRKEMQTFLKWLLAVKCPERILEVGTAVGFSALLMAEYDPVKCSIQRLKIMRSGFPSPVTTLNGQGERSRSRSLRAMLPNV